MRHQNNYRPKCYKCGRFIGKDGFIDICHTDEGWEEGYSECRKCLNK